MNGGIVKARPSTIALSLRKAFAGVALLGAAALSLGCRSYTDSETRSVRRGSDFLYHMREDGRYASVVYNVDARGVEVVGPSAEFRRYNYGTTQVSPEMRVMVAKGTAPGEARVTFSMAER